MSLYIVKADITNRDVDAIVCTANTNLHLGGLIGKKIIAKAGKIILTELNQIGHCDVGNSVITRGYGLKARNVIHTVGPIYQDGQHGEPDLLEKAYLSALKLAVKYNLETIEFPLISSGTYKYPNKEAAEIAIKTITKFLKNNELTVGLVIYSDKTFDECIDLFKPFKCYIGEGFVHQVEQYEYERERRLEMCHPRGPRDYECNGVPEDGIVKIKKRPTRIITGSADSLVAPADNFNSKLFYYLNQCGKSNPQVYKKAGIDRKLFSKIISHKDYVPKKITVICLIIGMELDIDDAEDLMAAAGYLFSDSILFDFIIKNFIEDENYNVFEINDVLYKNNQPLIC